jgi:hypothetical protein
MVVCNKLYEADLMYPSPSTHDIGHQHDDGNRFYRQCFTSTPAGAAS